MGIVDCAPLHWQMGSNCAIINPNAAEQDGDDCMNYEQYGEYRYDRWKPQRTANKMGGANYAAGLTQHSRPKLVCVLEGYLEPDMHLPIQVPPQLLKHVAVRMLLMQHDYGTQPSFKQYLADLLNSYAQLNTIKQSFIFLFNPFFWLYSPEIENLYQQTDNPYTLDFIRRNAMKFLVFRNVTFFALLNPNEEYTDSVHRYLSAVNREHQIPHIESISDLNKAIDVGVSAMWEVFSGIRSIQ